jgi:hypothetical protein
MTVSTREQQIQRQEEWEATHGPWHLERAGIAGDDYVVNPEGSWGEGVYGPLVHHADCWPSDSETMTVLSHLTWEQVKELEAQRRAGEPIGFCGHCIAKDGEDMEARAARILAEARAADPGLSERVAERRRARMAERGDRFLWQDGDVTVNRRNDESNHWGIDPDSGVQP